MHLNSNARFTLIGTLNTWRNSFYAAFIAYNDANIDLRNEFQFLFTSNTQYSSTLATIYTQSYVIFITYFRFFFLLNHMNIPVHLNSKILAVMKIKNSQKKYHQTSLIDKKKKEKYKHYWYMYYGTS